MSDDLDRDLDDLKRAISEVQAGQGDRAELAELLHAVERKLEAPDDAEHHEHLSDRLRDAIADFETDHPKLTAIIRRAADTLAASGI